MPELHSAALPQHLPFKISGSTAVEVLEKSAPSRRQSIGKDQARKHRPKAWICNPASPSLTVFASMQISSYRAVLPRLKDATWILRSGTIVHVGLRSSPPDEYTSLPAIQVPTLLPGRPNLIAVKRNPMEDIGALAKAEDVNPLWRAGKLYKSLEMECGCLVVN
ncbi:hypothetical protein HO173_006317 [Letharia columbiana]|uniref:Uncharacterized protein n=1 Tax=Letharia columbiana TaxID=112416 RepID=A0A8H6FVM8_9LECA|nr:uncharacterized protein HO173_006317 [Letharia columbiana]KAF6235634.1 hypothetical protein HO173_006317 [Letharia columbiana]